MACLLFDMRPWRPWSSCWRSRRTSSSLFLQLISHSLRCCASLIVPLAHAAASLPLVVHSSVAAVLVAAPFDCCCCRHSASCIFSCAYYISLHRLLLLYRSSHFSIVDFSLFDTYRNVLRCTSGLIDSSGWSLVEFVHMAPLHQISEHPLIRSHRTLRPSWSS